MSVNRFSSWLRTAATTGVSTTATLSFMKRTFATGLASGAQRSEFLLLDESGGRADLLIVADDQDFLRAQYRSRMFAIWTVDTVADLWQVTWSMREFEMTETAERIVPASRPVGEPTLDNFRWKNLPIPQPGPAQTIAVGSDVPT